MASLGPAQSWITLAPGGTELGCWNVANDPTRVLTAIANVRARFNIDPHRIILGGYSSGGDLSYRLAFDHAADFAGILVANSSPYLASGSSQTTALNAAWKINIVQLAHTQDTTYPLALITSETNALRAAGFPVTLITRPGNHYDTPAPGVPGTNEDVRSQLLPYLDGGWRSP
jgi:predicted esterase